MIPRSERECSFEVRDRQFLNPLATKVLQRAEERTVRIPADLLTTVECLNLLTTIRVPDVQCCSFSKMLAFLPCRQKW